MDTTSLPLGCEKARSSRRLPLKRLYDEDENLVGLGMVAKTPLALSTSVVVAEQRDGVVRARGEEPRLRRVEVPSRSRPRSPTPTPRRCARDFLRHEARSGSGPRLTAPCRACTVASSEAVANSGYFLWNATARTPFAWLAITLYGMLDRSMSNHCSAAGARATCSVVARRRCGDVRRSWEPSSRVDDPSCALTRHCLCRSYRYTYAAVQMNITGRFGWNSAARIGVFCCRKIRCDERLVLAVDHHVRAAFTQRRKVVPLVVPVDLGHQPCVLHEHQAALVPGRGREVLLARALRGGGGGDARQVRARRA